MLHYSNYTDFRKNLTKYMDMVHDDFTPMLVSRGNKPPVIMMSLEHFNKYDETAYLNASEANKKALEKSIANIEAGENLVTFTWEEYEKMSQELLEKAEKQ